MGFDFAAQEQASQPGAIQPNRVAMSMFFFVLVALELAKIELTCQSHAAHVHSPRFQDAWQTSVMNVLTYRLGTIYHCLWPMMHLLKGST